MRLGRDLALRIPTVKRVWDARRDAVDRQATLQSEIRFLKQAIALDHGEWRLSPFAHYSATFDPVALIRRYEAVERGSHPDLMTNFLGVRIDPDLFGGILPDAKGRIEPLPIPSNWHADIAEWGAALLCVEEARETFRMVELGCGWGCWLVNLGTAARSRSLALDLVGIEGDEQHLSSARAIMKINGFDPSQYRLTRGVAAPYRGHALFPVVETPGALWDSAPVFHPTEEQVRTARETRSHDVLDAYPLADLCGGTSIDLLHIDIQGGEVDFVQENFDDIRNLVKRVLIGTHSRPIEGRLQQFFLDAGWSVEMDRPAITAIEAGRPVVRVDGVHLYRNPAIA